MAIQIGRILKIDCSLSKLPSFTKSIIFILGNCKSIFIISVFIVANNPDAQITNIASGTNFETPTGKQ